MTEIGTATIKITPVLDIEGLDASIRVAVAQALRKMADEMDTPAAAEPAPRYYAEQINAVWGVRDRENEGEWAAYAPGDSSAADDAAMGALQLNAGSARERYEWTPTGTTWD